MFNTSTLLLSLVFSAIGAGYFLYGKRQQQIVPLLSGLVLSIFPYFISNTLLMLLVGAALLAVPFIIVL